MVCKDTLRIKHLPKELSDSQKEDFVKHFGAYKVKVITSKAKAKSVVYAKFESEEVAKNVMLRLHQITILNCRLCVEYAETDILRGQLTTQRVEDSKEGPDKRFFKNFINNINAFNDSVGFYQPPPAHLSYSYPKANRPTINNIAHALATVPRFYTQVLHLMNKMNLPPPFAMPDPPVRAIPGNQLAQNPVALVHLPAGEKRKASSSESELESDGEDCKKREIISEKGPVVQKKGIKRPKFIKQPVQIVGTFKPSEKAENVFETVDVQLQKKIEMKVLKETVLEKQESVSEKKSETPLVLTDFILKNQKPICQKKSEFPVVLKDPISKIKEPVSPKKSEPAVFLKDPISKNKPEKKSALPINIIDATISKVLEEDKDLKEKPVNIQKSSPTKASTEAPLIAPKAYVIEVPEVTSQETSLAKAIPQNSELKTNKEVPQPGIQDKTLAKKIQYPIDTTTTKPEITSEESPGLATKATISLASSEPNQAMGKQVCKLPAVDQKMEEDILILHEDVNIDENDKTTEEKLDQKINKPKVLQHEEIQTEVNIINQSESESTQNPDEPASPDEEFPCISLEELKANQITDLSVMPVFKKYSPGEPTNKLYIKNCAKTVVVQDLEYIYNRYREEGTEAKPSEFNIRLMQEGRMKGQAFVTLDSVEQAEKAVKETNGFILKDRPLIVVFGKAGKKK